MKVTEIADMPTVIKFENMYPTDGVHESVFRSFHIVAKLKEILEQGTPPAVALEMLELMTANRREETWKP